MRKDSFLGLLTIVCIATSLLLLTLPLSTKALSLPDSNGSADSLQIIITDASYGDFDGDSFKDDVFAEVKIKIFYPPPYELHYWITLVLPSGLNYSYLVELMTTEDKVYTLNYFFDHAIESGDYTIIAEAELNAANTLSDSHIYVFDPPGGSPGGKPTFLAMTI
ncbi:MAG: hypothetical protein ACFFCZ_22210 [Promethearchaeota archaeon]